MMLERADIALGVSEAHGVVIGLLCAGATDDNKTVAALGAGESDGDLRDGLEIIRQGVIEDVAEAGLGLGPLLPDDDSSAVIRSRALIDWCRGFVTGFSLYDYDREVRDYPEIVTEALTDIGGIAEASGTAGESDLSELVEYLRVATQLIYDEVAK